MSAKFINVAFTVHFDGWSETIVSRLDPSEECASFFSSRAITEHVLDEKTITYVDTHTIGELLACISEPQISQVGAVCLEDVHSLLLPYVLSLDPRETRLDQKDAHVVVNVYST